MKVLITGGSGFIGTNAVQTFAAAGHEVCNLSLHCPLDKTQGSFWRRCDILNAEATAQVFAEVKPEWVIHLAARTDCDETTTVERGYRANTDGTGNVLEAIRRTPSIERVIITSTQFVCGPGSLPQHDEEYFPETIYGQSKIITEQRTRSADLQCCWTIIRPTNIWGPWHLRYRREFWRVLQRGIYLHPRGERVVRSYGYVKNVVHQMRRILDLPIPAVCGRTIYVGDAPADLILWVNGFSRALTGHEVRTVPRAAVRTMARLGDIATAARGKPFLINSSRYRSMITDYDTPMGPTFDLLGENPYTLAEGIDETVRWLRSYSGPDHLRTGNC